MKPNFSLKIFLSAAIIAMMLYTACTRNFDAINTDKTQIIGVSEKEFAGLFSNAQINGVCWLTGDQYGRATRYWANLLSGYFVTNSFSSEQLVIDYDHLSAVTDDFFSKAMPAIVAIQQNAKESDPAAYHLATIWKAYVMYQLVDVWGPLPYKEVGTGKSAIPYESVQDVYNDIFNDLKAAVDYLTTQDPSLNVFGAGDIIYNGDVSKWIKFANTMRLRLAMRISNIDPDRAKTEAEAAVQGPTMDSNDDNAWIVNLPSFNGVENGMVRNKTSMIMSANMESFLKGYNDPRLPVYFSPVPNTTIAGAPPEIAANAGTY
ncbi:MAG TPA: SusD/RagB family nutrient-binding outer membrane lipoprotein, partial [Puia sp.]